MHNTGASTALTEDSLMKWDPKMDEWADLLEGEAKEDFLNFKSSYLKIAHQQAEIFHMVCLVSLAEVLF